MIKFKNKNYLQILFISSIFILISAFIIEHGLGFKPCSLCIIERIPYGLSILILVLNYNFNKNLNFFSILLILVFLFSILISIYHLGIEQEFFEESAVCKPDELNLISKEDVLNSLQELRISCKNVAFKIFGLSLTTYNIFLSILMFLLSTKIYLLSNGFKK